MSPARGYYSLVQYCPDPGRAEVANVGVLLFCPERSFLEVRFSEGSRRITRFFGRGSYDPGAVKAARQALRNRLEVERSSFGDVRGLQAFIDTRANDIRITAPRPVKVIDRASDLLDRLFGELVAAPENQKAIEERRSAVASQLAEHFRKSRARDRIQTDYEVEVPVVRRNLKVPYAYRNGAVNLVYPQTFAAQGTAERNRAPLDRRRLVRGRRLRYGIDSDRASWRVQGRLLHAGPDTRAGPQGRT